MDVRSKTAWRALACDDALVADERVAGEQEHEQEVVEDATR
jgi:hypothetical protein